MDLALWSKYVDEAPESVQEYLLDRQSGRNTSAAQEKLAYDHDAWNRIMDVVWDTVFAKLSQGDFKERIRRLAGDRKPEDVERAVLFHVVLPLADLVEWDVDARLGSLGVAQADIQSVARVSLRPVSYGAAVRRIAAQAKLSILSEELVRRLREIFVSYVKGVRTIEQVKEMMQRQQGEGGIGFSAEQADRYLESMKQFLATTRVMSEQEYADWLTKEREVKTENANVKSDGRSAQTVTGDEAEIASMAARAPKPPDHLATALDQAIESAVASVNASNLDESMGRRLRNIISTRLRDVRNAFETKAVLTRDPKVGGMGLPAEEADRIAGVIETMYQQHRQPIEDEQKKKIEAVQVEQKTKIDERRKRESEEHAQWFQEKVAATRGEDALRAQMLKAMQSGTQERQNAGTQGGSATVDSVKPPAVRLAGLAEELGGLTAAEFRRMARTPEAAAEKIRQKIETLKAESFDRWTAGVEAWRQSPIQQQYLKLVAASFAAGRPVAELVEERRASDPETLSADEVGAIVQLNGKIQF